MEQPDFGVMVHMFFDDDEGTVKAFEAAKGKRIVDIALKDYQEKETNCLSIGFENGLRIRIFDDGQSCCEDRYMTTDDKLSDFIGATLIDLEIKDGPVIEDEHGVHEQQFLHVTTSKGVFVMESHNQHNGYYGGFYIVIREE